jgi:tetratricopeptide (TPR) repeat protein
MAKRKRLNRNTVIVLVTMGGLLLLGTLAVGWRFRHRIFRKDPAACMRLAKAAWDRGDYDKADQSFGDALLSLYYSRRTDPQTAVYYYDYARFLLDWVRNRRAEMTDTQRRDRYTGAVNWLRRAVMRDPNHLDAQRGLTDIAWEVSRSSSQWIFFINEADRLLSLEPNNHKTCFLRAKAWEEMAKNVPGQNSENAIRDFKSAVEMKPDEPAYWESYAFFLQQEGRSGEADKVYDAAVAAIPDNPELHVEYANFLRSRDRPEEATKQIQEAINRAPSSPIGNLALAESYLGEGKNDLALKALDAARKIDEDDYRVHAFLSQIYRAQKQPDKAIETLRQGLAAIDKRIKDTSTSAPAAQQQGRLEGNKRLLTYVLADSLLDRSVADPNNRQQYLAEAKELAGQAAWAPAESARRARVMGKIAYLEGDIPLATRFLEEAYQGLGGFDAQVADYLIQIYLRQDLPGKAEKILDRFRRNPAYANDPKALLLKARLEMQYRNLEQAAKYADQVLKSDPNSTEARNIRKAIMAAQGLMPLEQALAGAETSKADVAGLINRAASMWVEDDKDSAVRLLEALRAKVPDNFAVFQRLLWMYSARDDVAKAKQLIEQARSAFPDKIVMLDLQEKFLQEKDPNKRFEIALSAVEGTADPFQKAMEKAQVAAMFHNEPAFVSYVREAAKINPDDPVVIERLFKIALLGKDWKQAEECVKRATQGNIDSVEGRVFSAQLAMAQGQHAQAIPLLVETLRRRPEAKYPAIMLGDCYVQTNDIAKAREVYEIVANNDPGYVPAVIRMAMITEQQGKMAECAEWVTRAQRLDPTNAYVRKRYLETLEEKADPAEVITERQKALRRDPNDLENRLRLAGLYERTKQNDKAEEMYVSVYQRSSNRLSGTALLAGFYARTNRFSDADRLLVDMLQTYPDKVAAYLLYGDFLSGLSPEQGRVAVEKAIAADPNDPRGYAVLARLLASTRDFKGAADAMTKYAELRPGDQAAKKELVRFYVDAGQYAQAQQQLEAMLTASPSDAEALTIMGIMMLKQGEMSKGLGFLDRAITANPNYAEAFTARATVYMTQGMATEAKLDLEKAKRLSDRPTIAVELAGVHVRLGDMTRAQGILRDVLNKPETADYAPAISMLADLYFQQERWQLLASLLGQAKQKFPNSPRYRQMEARMYAATGDRAKAVAALEQAVADLPGAADLLRDYLLALMGAGQYTKVLSVSQSYLNKSGYESWVPAIRAEALAKSGDSTRADEAFLTATNGADAGQLSFVVQRMVQAYGPNRTIEKLLGWLGNRPKDPTLHRLLGVLYNDQQEHSKASEMFLKAVELSADDNSKAAVRRELALSYYQLRKYPQAEEAYLAALKVLGDDVTVMNNLAYMYANDTDQPDKALPYAEKAATIMPQNADILDTYGWTLARLARHGEAEKHLLRAIQLSETPTQAALPRYHLGYVYEQMDRLTEALRQYRQGGEAVSGKTKDPLYKDLSEAIKRAQQKQVRGPATTRSAA